MDRHVFRKLVACTAFGLAPIVTLIARYGISLDTPKVVAAARPISASPTSVQVDVSNAGGSQAEVALALDPTDDHNLLAGSNTRDWRIMEAYGSTDGGVSWEASAAPPVPI